METGRLELQVRQSEWLWMGELAGEWDGVERTQG